MRTVTASTLSGADHAAGHRNAQVRSPHGYMRNNPHIPGEPTREWVRDMPLGF